MTNARENQPPGDPFEMSLSSADDRLRLSRWLPPREGIVPHIRIGRRWINILWVMPLAFVVLIFGVAVAQELRTIPAVQEFLARYPGVPASAPAVHSGFPLWLRLEHFFNLFFMIFIIRSGIRFSRITRGCIGGAIARQAQNGFVFKMRFLRTGFGHPRTTR